MRTGTWIGIIIILVVIIGYFGFRMRTAERALQDLDTTEQMNAEADSIIATKEARIQVLEDSRVSLQDYITSLQKELRKLNSKKNELDSKYTTPGDFVGLDFDVKIERLDSLLDRHFAAIDDYRTNRASESNRLTTDSIRKLADSIGAMRNIRDAVIDTSEYRISLPDTIQ